ncbi:MAG: septum site-determining protein MinC [Firmicutes bacterium]|nr:septum site-determining protein MinC [Bacillota bacterium]
MGKISKEDAELLGYEQPRQRKSPGKRSPTKPDKESPPLSGASSGHANRWAYEWETAEEARRHPTLLVRRTLRSGQRIRFYGNVVVLGDVNPGAEITAGGDIIVMGWLRGVAHAGAGGNNQAVVSAFRLNPIQLRIGEYIGRAADEGEPTVPDVPEIAEVRDGRVVIDRWQHSMLTSYQRED